MKTIQLSRGYSTIVDDDIFEKVKHRPWWAFVDRAKRNVYAISTMKVNGKRQNVRLHRLIMGFPESLVDHKNTDTLDNRRENLRLATDSQNKRNQRRHLDGSSSYKGVRWHAQRNKWTAQIGFMGKQFYLGIFSSEKDAAIAYDVAATRMWGEFARPNF